MKYSRILIKLSGEALMGEAQSGIEPSVIQSYAHELRQVHELGAQVAIVIGGGNIFRGVKGVAEGMDRSQSDYMGMLATVINALALQEALERIGVDTRVQSAIEIEKVCENYIRRRAIRHLEKGRVVILAAGTGNPFFTTDTAASLRAAEIEAQVVLKGTKVDGIYTADPNKDHTATRYERITFEEAIHHRLEVMDMTAFTLCQENALPIIVYNVHEKGALRRIVLGEAVGTLVH